MDLKNIFRTSKNTTTILTPDGLEAKREKETFTDWGARICGMVTGSLYVLPAYLQKVYNSIYQAQTADVAKQNQLRDNIQSDIDKEDNNLQNLRTKIRQANDDIIAYEENISEKKDEITRLLTEKENTTNKHERLKLIIGLVILIPLTFYLFLFYSSTFYSAFFREPTTLTNVMNAMFDSHAIQNAYTEGITELGFVLSAPVIFLGLGFALHFFSVQKNKTKYLKMAAILIVTVMFDCILAYKIGEQMHTVGIMIGTYPIGQEYTVAMAVRDINTWAVIFCGFIVYVIWGIVFDLIMDAYDKLDSNKTQIKSLKAEIKDLTDKIDTEKKNIAKWQNDETDSRNKIAVLTSKLGSQVLIDYNAIRAEMNNFFAGWIRMMGILKIKNTDLTEANNIYNREIKNLIIDKQIL